MTDQSPPAVDRQAVAKGGRLTDGAATEEALASSRSVLRGTGFGRGTRGLQQFFSPPEAAELAFRVLSSPHAPTIAVDPTAGDGALLARWPRGHRFGIEIDPDQIAAGDYTAIRGDINRVYPLLQIAGTRFDSVVCNPPFGLDWPAASGGTLNSTLLTLRYANGLLTERGQGMMIAGRDRLVREVLHRPEAAGVYALIDCDDLFEGVEMPIAIAFFVTPGNHSGDHGAPTRTSATRAELTAKAAWVEEARAERCGHVTTYAYAKPSPGLEESWATIEKEHDRRRRQAQAGRPRYDVSRTDGKLGVHLSAFAQIALSERGILREVERLNGVSLHYFALNAREWRALDSAAADGCLELDPAVRPDVEAVVEQALREATPMYPVPPQMRLGFVADLERLHCVKDDSEHGYSIGETYALHARTRVETEKGTKLVQGKEGEESRDYRRERKLLEITVGSHSFDESPESIEHLIEHFDIPDPGDIATKCPRELERAKRVLLDIAAEHGFEYDWLPPEVSERLDEPPPDFQLEDLARLLVKGKGVLSWEQGLGKSLGQLVFAEACFRYWRAQRCALFVIPQDLLPQWQREARKFLGRDLEVIDTQAKARAVAADLKRGGEGFYVTWYEALSLSGRRDEALPAAQVLREGEHRFTRARLDADSASLLDSESFCPACRELPPPAGEWTRNVCGSCAYVHKRRRVRTIASYLSTAFRRGVVCVDELSMIRGDESLRSQAVRALRAAHPLGATGTPIANFVDDLFWGFWWALGNASNLWPYEADGGRAKFQADHCVIETIYNEKEDGSTSSRKKILPEVTNLSVLWRLLSSGMVRRRADGLRPFDPVYHEVEVPFGRAQLEQHSAWLKGFEQFFTETHPHSPLVEAGVVHLFASGLGQLPKLDYAATMPCADPDADWTGVAGLSNWTPKNLKVLEIALERARAGDKILIGSCLIETGRWIAERLQERGVRARHIVEERDGKAQTKNPRKRAAEIYDFIEGDAQVLCAGVQAVKLGHNLDIASTVILTGLPWSHEALDQFIKRVVRRTSRRPIRVYVVLTKGQKVESIDARKWELLARKGAASDLALDGQLIVELEEQVDWSKVLREMQARGVSADGTELAESDCQALWQRAEGPYAPVAPPIAPVIALPRPPRPETTAPTAREQDGLAEDDGQLTLDLAA